jgi:hypothetical protein
VVLANTVPQAALCCAVLQLNGVHWHDMVLMQMVLPGTSLLILLDAVEVCEIPRSSHRPFSGACLLVQWTACIKSTAAAGTARQVLCWGIWVIL